MATDSPLSLRRLEVFRLVVEERSVTRAAEVLMIAQPAVSAQLRSLEEWIGAKLFVRRGNRLVLTEAGSHTYEWAKEILASAAQIRRDVGDVGEGRSGSVVIAASMAVGTYLLPTPLAELGEARPGVDITVMISPPDETLRSVETGECDFAVLNWDERELPDTVSSELLRVEPLLVCAPPAAVPEPDGLTIDEVLALPFVGAPRGVVYQRNLMAQLRNLSAVTPRFLIRLGHSESMKTVAMERGWALFMPRYTVTKELRDGSLVALEVPGLEVVENLVLVWRRDKIFSPLQDAALESVREHMKSFMS